MIQTKSLSPKMIYDKISETVVSQDEAKRAIATALHLHYVTAMQYHKTDKSYPKCHTLLMGPSGNGKTFLIKEGIKALQELTGTSIGQLVEIDCTTLSVGGVWKGLSLGDYIATMYKKTKDPFSRETAVIYLDEFDKLCIPMSGSSGDDMHKQIQYALLKLVEGMEQEVEGRTSLSLGTTINTRQMLFIFSGNFAEIRKTEDDDKKGTIGFTPIVDSNIIDIKERLQKAGLATQLIGRIGQVAKIHRLNKDELMDILVNHALPRVKTLFSFMKRKFTIKKKDLKEIVDYALKIKTGARGVQAGLDRYVTESLFDVSYDTVYNTPEPEYKGQDLTPKEVLHLGSMKIPIIEDFDSFEDIFNKEPTEEELEELRKELEEEEGDPTDE